MKNKISKDDFVLAIEDVKNVNKYTDGLNNYFHKNGVDGYIFQPDCSETVLRLLHNLFEESDKDGWIEYFCFELDFGAKWKRGMITKKDGSDIKLQTPQDLYDYLCECE